MTGSTSDWTNFKNHKTTLDKDITKSQKQYISDKLNNTTDRWKTLKEINKQTNGTHPQLIVHNNKVIYSAIRKFTVWYYSV